MHNVKRILVVKPSSLGDIVHTFPALELLHRSFPDAELDYLVNPVFSGALDYSPWHVSRKIFFERSRLGKVSTFFSAFRQLAKELREYKYDLVIDFQGLFRSGFFSRLAAGRKGIVAGFAHPRENSAAWFYSIRVETKGTHAVERNLELAGYFAGEVFAPDMSIPVRPTDVELPTGLPERYLLLLPGARWMSKRFPVKLFAEIAAKVVDGVPGLIPVIAGSPDETEVAAELASLLPGSIDICGKTTLPGVFETIRNAAGVICNDSGPMHIGALMHRPLCVFFGSTKPGATGPWGSPRVCRIFRNEKLSCLECMRRSCVNAPEKCFNIDASSVAEAMISMLADEMEVGDVKN